MIGLLLAVVTSIQPAAPTVGDPITVRFPAPVVLEASESYEVVSIEGNVAVVRTFRPAPLVLRGRAGAVPFDDVVIPVRSVLGRNDTLQPAPFSPPKPLPMQRTPWIAVAAAALFAAAAWLLAWRSARAAPVRAAASALPPHEQFRRAVSLLRAQPESVERWAALADETRRFLAATRPSLGIQLTTTEVLRRLRREDALIELILSQGDLEKFSPWGALRLDFDSVAERALELAVEPADGTARDAA